MADASAGDDDAGVQGGGDGGAQGSGDGGAEPVDAGPDSDGDGLSDADELARGTDPNAPDSDGDGLSDGEEVTHGTDPLNPDSDGDGFTDREEVFLGTNPSGEGGGCAASSAGAVASKRPVDVILIVDNSSSMNGEIAAIVERINVDFAAILEEMEVDYRVILLSRHGSIEHKINGCDDHGICIEEPLSSGACDPQAAPKLTERFKQYSVCIDSTDGLKKAMDSFDGSLASAYFDASENAVTLSDAPDGWRTWLRDGALRTFLMVTDDDSNTRADAFKTWMYGQDARYFGTEADPNWIFHAILGISENDPESSPWLPENPVVETECEPGSDGIGRDYQDLSKESGGLRFSICKNENFDALFRAIATSVIEVSKLSCTFKPKAVDGAGDADYSRALVLYESGAGDRRTLAQVTGADQCATNAFYVQDGAIHLCPEICAAVEADLAGSLKTLVACFNEETCGNGELDPGEGCDDGNLVPGDGCDAECRFEGPVIF